MIRALLARGRGRARELEPREAYALWASSYPRRPANELMRAEQRALLALLPPLAGMRVLDVGCGSGRYLELVAARGGNAVGLDACHGMLLRARDLTPRLVGAELPRLPLRDASVDVVVCALVVGHLAELDPTLVELGRLLRPGGVIVYSDLHPDAARYRWRRTFVAPDARVRTIRHHVHGLDAHRQACRRAGLELEALSEGRVEDGGRWHGVPAALALRARKPRAARDLRGVEPERLP